MPAAADVLPPLASQLAGRILVDCTNPVGPGLTHALAGGQSGSAVIQALVPGTAVVKAFTVYGFENLENNDYPGYGVRPAMPYCGADPAARRRVGELIDQLGWEPVDVGGLEQAVHLEHLALLWIRMVRVGGADPGIVWAALRRSAPAPGPHPAE
jgi:8-hydroxy-5-deazaflavin:NADPH oxidoreductase